MVTPGQLINACGKETPATRENCPRRKLSQAKPSLGLGLSPER